MVSRTTLELQQVSDLQCLVDLHPELVHLHLLLLGLVVLTSVSVDLLLHLQRPQDHASLPQLSWISGTMNYSTQYVAHL